MSYIGQAEDEWEAAQKKKARAAARRRSKRCQVCGKRLSSMEGLKMHLRDVHDLKIAPPKPKTYHLIPIEEK